MMESCLVGCQHEPMKVEAIHSNNATGVLVLGFTPPQSRGHQNRGAMAMAAAESCSKGGNGGYGGDLAVSLVQREDRNEELPWSSLLSQLENSVKEVQGHFNHHFQARLHRRDGGWQVGGWGRRERSQQRGRVALRGGRFAAIIPGDSLAETVISSGIFSFLNIYNTLLVARLILTWFPNPPAVIANPLSTICDPYLNIFRGIIPPLGGTLDLSPILAFLALDVFTNTATALPCELPPTTPTTETQPDSHPNWRQLVQLKKGGLSRPTKRE